jgi:hypothetical protein
MQGSANVAIERRTREVALLCRAMGRAVKKGDLPLAQTHAEKIRRLRSLNAERALNYIGRRNCNTGVGYHHFVR